MQQGVRRAAWAGAVLVLLTGVAMAAEQAAYEVLGEREGFELRRYAPQVLAQTVVEEDFERAGNVAFRRLFGYISGDNRPRRKIAMTAPVVQEPARIDRTGPVVAESDGGRWRVAFILPAGFTLESAPEPTDPRVELRGLPERLVAAVRFSGRWDSDRFREHEAELRARLADEGLEVVGEAVWARYDPPFKPWFLRRNEVLVPVAPSK